MGKEMLTLKLNRKTRSCLSPYGLFQPLGIVGTGPKECSYFHKGTGKSYTAFYFLTFTLPFFTELFQVWYIHCDGKKSSTF